jgi:hemolysin activation/secretion protein
VDDKLFSDSSEFSGKSIGTDARSRPLTLGVAMRRDEARSKANVSVSYLRNLSGGERNSDEAYAAVRGGASRNWDLWRANADLSVQLQSGFTVALRGSAQRTNQPLIGGEQFGMGGQYSVRALETRQVMGDSGLQASFEVWLPPLKNGLSVLGFVDAGHITREQPAASTTAQEDALAVGLGLRWQLSPMSSLSLDYGYLLDGVTGTPSGHERLYATLAARF